MKNTAIAFTIIMLIMASLFLIVKKLNANEFNDVYYPPHEELPYLRQISLIYIKESKPMTYQVGRFQGEVILTIPCKDGTAYVMLDPR